MTATLNLSVSVGISAPTGPLTASITWQDGTQTVYSSASAVDKGDYVDPAGLFVQGSLLATDATHPEFRVWFRSNKSGFAYDSVIFEYGDTFNTAAADLPPYSVTISKNGVVLYTYKLPTNTNGAGHYWGARWRWQSAPFPRNRTTAAALIAAKLAPNGPNTAILPKVPTYSAFTYTPMTLAGLTPFQGQSGGRNDIGFYTGWQMAWLWGGSSAMLDTIFAQADAAATFPAHFRDPKTQAVIDAAAYPTATRAGNPGQAFHINPPPSAYNGGALSTDIGHRPACQFIPFQLSGDPYFLEEQQFAVADGLFEDATRGQGAGRYYAWPLRDALHAILMTPASVPSWLLTKTQLTAYLKYYTDYMNSWASGTAGAGPDAAWAASHFNVTKAGGARSYTDDLPAGTYFVPWQEAYVDMSHAYALIWGFTQFTGPFQWHLESNLARCNGTSGWARAFTAGYQMAFTWGCKITALLDATTPTPLIAVDHLEGAPSGNFPIRIENEQFLVQVATGGLQVITRGYNGTTPRAHVATKEVVSLAYYNNWAEAFAGNNAMWTSYGKPMTFAAGDPTGMNKIQWLGGGLGDVDYTGSHYYSQVVINAVPSSFFLPGKFAEANACLAWFNIAIPEAQTRQKTSIPFNWVATPWV